MKTRKLLSLAFYVIVIDRIKDAFRGAKFTIKYEMNRNTIIYFFAACLAATIIFTKLFLTAINYAQ